MSDLWETLRQIDWSEFQTAYGRADQPVFRQGLLISRSVPDDLDSLRSPDLAVAEEAVHDLDNSLCHQHVQLSAAALPALPFVLTVLDGVWDSPDEAADGLVEGLLDILFGFAIATAVPAVKREAEPAWRRELFDRLVSELPRFKQLCAHRLPYLGEEAEALVDVLENPEHGQGYQGPA